MAAHYMVTRVAITHCIGVDCGREFDVQVKYGRRGLCTACTARANRANQPRTRTLRPLETVIEEYAFLHEQGVPPRDMPERLGMSRKAFEKAMYRGRRAGDPRVASFRGMGRAA